MTRGPGTLSGFDTDTGTHYMLTVLTAGVAWFQARGVDDVSYSDPHPLAPVPVVVLEGCLGGHA